MKYRIRDWNIDLPASFAWGDVDELALVDEFGIPTTPVWRYCETQTASLCDTPDGSGAQRLRIYAAGLFTGCYTCRAIFQRMMKGRINHPNDYVVTNDGRKWAFDFQNRRWVPNDQALLDKMIAMRASGNLVDADESSTWTYDCENKMWLLNEPQVLDTGGCETIKGLAADFQSKVVLPDEVASDMYYCELYIPGEQVAKTEHLLQVRREVQNNVNYIIDRQARINAENEALAELWDKMELRKREELQIELLKKQNAAIDLLTLAAGFYVGRKISEFGNG